MFEMFMNKEYLVIVLMALTVFFLLYINPAEFQNKRYKVNGNGCPNASWHALILLVVGTILYFLVNKYQCNLTNL